MIHQLKHLETGQNLTTKLHKPNLADQTLQLLKDGESRIVLSEQHKNVVLLLGNTGSGKSTLVQWLAGDNSKLIAKEVNLGEYLIEDGNRIGNSTINSKTLFPELVVHPKTGAAFYDSPGFSDTRSTSFDVASSYFIKKVADNVEAVKLLFVVNYPSVRKGIDRQDLMKLLRHSMDIIKNVDKFAQSIGLVVTKVDNHFVKNGTNFTLVPDAQVIAAIANFLREIRQSLEERLNQADISQKNAKFYRKSIKFVSILLSQNDQKGYTRIGIFRRPLEAGPLSEIVMFQEGKKHIERILSDYVQFTRKDTNDFGYTISDTSKNNIGELVETINDNVWYDLSVIVEKAETFYQNLVTKTHTKINSFVTSTKMIKANRIEAQTTANLLDKGLQVCSDLVNKTTNSTTSELASLLTQSLANLNIEAKCKNNLENISNQGKYFDFLQIVSDNRLATRPWTDLLKSLVSSISHSNENIQVEATNVLEKIKIKINSIVDDLVGELKNNYQKKMLSLEICELPSWLAKEGVTLLGFRKQIDNATNVQELAVKILQNLFNLELKNDKIEQITKKLYYYGKYVFFLQSLSNSSTFIFEFTTKFDEINNLLNDSIIWYAFLNNLHLRFSQYDIQQYSTRYNVASLDDWSTVGKAQGILITRSNFKQFLDKIQTFKIAEFGQISQLMKTQQISDEQLRELNQLLSLTLKNNLNFYCAQSDKLVIKGDYVKLSDLIDANSKIQKQCSSDVKLNSVNIFATQTLFIDGDVNALGEQLKLIIIAPEWQIIDNRVITLEGAYAIEHYPSKADDGIGAGSRGLDGLPGLPGGPGGSFFGIGMRFINFNKLTISVSGGAGGRGQNGGDGTKGLAGNSLDIQQLDEFCSENHMCVCKSLNCANNRKKRNAAAVVKFGQKIIEAIVKLFRSAAKNPMQGVMMLETANEIDGFLNKNSHECSLESIGGAGGVGGLGGNGGNGGVGGLPGEVKMFGLVPKTNDKIKSKVGPIGVDGQGGKGAENGDSGDDFKVQCTYDGDGTTVSSKILKYTAGNSPTTGRVANGTDGYLVENRTQPKQPDLIRNHQKIVNEYRNYLRENLNNANYRFKRHSLIQFLNWLNSDKDTNSVYDNFGLSEELQALNEQSSRLNADDLLSFYQSLLVRIDEYSRSLPEIFIVNLRKQELYKMHNETLSKILNLQSSLLSTSKLNSTGRVKRSVENFKTVPSKFEDDPFPPLALSTTRASSFVDQIKHFYANAISKIVDFHPKLALNSSRIEYNTTSSRSSSTNLLNITNSVDINGSLVFGQFLTGLLWGKNNSLTNYWFQSPAQEQTVRIENLSQQILPILNRTDFFDQN